jgi:hypothetical protein
LQKNSRQKKISGIFIFENKNSGQKNSVFEDFSKTHSRKATESAAFFSTRNLQLPVRAFFGHHNRERDLAMNIPTFVFEVVDIDGLVVFASFYAALAICYALDHQGRGLTVRWPA